MFETISYQGTRDQQYKLVLQQIEALIADEPNDVANLSNASALLNQFFDDVNWVGFYLIDENKKDELVLGPFQGLPACIRIKVGSGVCGSAVQRRESILVDNVNEFPGHIFCDGASLSELVVPLFNGEEVVGVLDIDSPSLNRFDEVDQAYMEKFARILEKQLWK